MFPFGGAERLCKAAGSFCAIVVRQRQPTDRLVHGSLLASLVAHPCQARLGSAIPDASAFWRIRPPTRWSRSSARCMATRRLIRGMPDVGALAPRKITHVLASAHDEGPRARESAACLRSCLLSSSRAALGWVWDATDRASWASLGRDQGSSSTSPGRWGRATGLPRRSRRERPRHPDGARGLPASRGHRRAPLSCPRSPRAPASRSRSPGSSFRRWRTRQHRGRRCTFALAWALAAWVALSAQYVVYGFWDTAQRESFLDWFVLVSVALQATSFASGEPRSRSTQATLAGDRLPLLRAVARETDVRDLHGRAAPHARARARDLEDASSPARSVPRRGSARRDDPARLRRVARRSRAPGHASRSWTSPRCTASSGHVRRRRSCHCRGCRARADWRSPRASAWEARRDSAGSRAARSRSRRCLSSVSSPSLVQAKGFPYHFHPVTLGIPFAWLVALGAIWERSAPEPTLAETVRRGVVVVLSVLVGARAAYLARVLPIRRRRRCATRQRSRAHRDSLPSIGSTTSRGDAGRRCLRRGADGADDRVQTYAMDAYLLFLAGRRSATPYVYAYDLNADAAMHGSFEEGGLQPTATRSNASERCVMRTRAISQSARAFATGGVRLRRSLAAHDLARRRVRLRGALPRDRVWLSAPIARPPTSTVFASG